MSLRAILDVVSLNLNAFFSLKLIKNSDLLIAKENLLLNIINLREKD